MEKLNQWIYIPKSLQELHINFKSVYSFSNLNSELREGFEIVSRYAFIFSSQTEIEYKTSFENGIDLDFAKATYHQFRSSSY